MIEIAGKQVLTDLSELVDPQRAALVIIDMQRDFVEPGFAFDSLGIDLSMYPPMRPKVAALLAGARAAGTPVIHVQMTTLPNRQAESPAQMRFNLRMHERNAGGTPLQYTEAGTPGHEFVDELTPGAGELVIAKWRSSGFWGTNLDMILRSNGITSIIVAGCTTEGCVESTARDALFNDYYVVIAEDCVASDDRAQHEASLLLMRNRFDVVGSTAILGEWSKLKP